MSAPVYPMMMPLTGLASSDFQIDTFDTENTLRSGSGHSTQIAPPQWTVAITTTNLISRTERFRKWRSFVDALRGRKKTALLYDPDQPYPAAYPHGLGGLLIAGSGTPFDGTGGVDVRTNANQFDISGLPANFQLLASDYIGFVKGDRYWLCRLVTDAVANSGGESTVYVEPQVPPHFDAAATYNLVRPIGEFILESHNGGRDLEGKPISMTFKSRAF